MKVLAEAMDRLIVFVEKAAELEDVDARCATLASSFPDGKPSVRIVYIEKIDHDGLIFFVNTKSGKALQMLANPWVAICYFWSGLRQQVNIEGEAAMLSESDSDHFWKTRRRDSQLAAWASNQSELLDEPGQLLSRRENTRKKYSFEQVPRPENWRAFRVMPSRLEFWHGDWRRMKGRERYERDQDGHWQTSAYNP